MSNSRYRRCLFSLSLCALLLPLGAVSGQDFEDLYMVDSPTAGILSHGGYLFDGSIGPESSLLFGVKVGFHDRLMLGFSFGLQEFIGRGDIDVNDQPGFEVRLRLIEETTVGPALAFGFNTQGEGQYFSDSERYERKSKGFYAVMSKNYNMIRDLSLHGGVNYSLENEYEEGIDFFGGFTLGLIPGLDILLDYKAALDDNDSEVESSMTRGRGYLDTGIRITYEENLRLKILFKDLLDNYEAEHGVARCIELYYINYF